jgi:hypothetical protein
MIAIVADAAKLNGKEGHQYIVLGMPLRQIYGFEHVYYTQHGYTCTPRAWRTSLEEIAEALK